VESGRFRGGGRERREQDKGREYGRGTDSDTEMNEAEKPNQKASKKANDSRSQPNVKTSIHENARMHTHESPNVDRPRRERERA
jgi:hypothetical protein